MHRYENYKPSGVKWIGDLPAHWNVWPGFTCFEENKDRNRKLTEKTVLSLSYGRIIVKPDEKLTGLVPESFDTYQLIKPGDIVIRTTDLQNDKTSLRVGLAKNKGMITSAYLGLRCKPEIHPEFLFRLLESYDALKVFYGMGSGLRQNIDFWDFKRLPIPLPPKSEQDRIVTFLNRKTSEIDTAIAQKERLIDLLFEQLGILINSAVTRGLNRDVTFIDSGIEWIGQIPSHWSASKLVWICDSIRDGTHNPPAPKESEFRLLSVRNIVNGKFVTREDDRTMSAQAFKGLCRSYTVSPGDVVLALVGGTTGKSAVVEMDCKTISVQRSLGILRPLKSKVLPAYLNFSLKASGLQRQIWDTATKYAAQPGIYLADVASLKIALPSIKEQQEIIEHCSVLETKVAQMVDATRNEIRALSSLKLSLIAEAAFGKIKV